MYKQFVIGLLAVLCIYSGSAADATCDTVDLPVSQQIAIDGLVQTRPPQVVATHLYGSHKNATFDEMVESQIYLYWKNAAQNQHNWVYLRNVAYYIREIRNNPLFGHLSAEAKQRLDAVVADLPPTLRYIFLETYSCLLNRLYTEFFYVTDAIDIDSERRYAFTNRRSQNSIGPNGSFKAFYETQMRSSSGHLDMKVALQGFGLFVYREKEVEALKNMLVAWRSGAQPSNSQWSMELVDGKFLVFSQDDYLLCASPNDRDTLRRYVYAYNDGRSKNSPECQWIAKDCPF